MIKTKFLQTCIGVSIVLLSLGFLFQSVQSASAAPTPEKFFQSGSNKIGKYQMQYHESNGVSLMWIWDTETGTSCNYYYQKGVWTKNTTAPPANPMSN